MKKGGSLQITVPAQIKAAMGLQPQDIVSVDYDFSGEFMRVRKSRSIRCLTLEEKKIFDILKESKALLPLRHYVLASGMHSASYLHVRLAIARQDSRSVLTDLIAEKVEPKSIDLVAGFSVGGLLIAKKLSEQFGCELVVGRKIVEDDVRIEFAIGKFTQMKNLLLIDDILTTGGSMHKAIESLKRAAVTVSRIAVVVDRSRRKVRLAVPLTKLISLDLDQYKPTPSSCPLCAKHVRPLVDLSEAEMDESRTLGSLLDGENREVLQKAFEEVRLLQRQAFSEFVGR